MKITSVYQQYPITPTLAQHMIRAASVGAYIADHWIGNHILNKDTIITMLLLHDTANIVKFDLENFPQLLGNELPRIEYWKTQQKIFIENYGSDEHAATKEIAREVGIQGRAMELLNNMGSRHIKEMAEHNDFEQKICMYSDLRVGPFGILTVNERFDELIHRYKGRAHELGNIEKTEEKRKWCLVIEKQLQEHVSFSLNEISDKTIESYIPLCSNYVISSALVP